MTDARRRGRLVVAALCLVTCGPTAAQIDLPAHPLLTAYGRLNLKVSLQSRFAQALGEPVDRYASDDPDFARWPCESRHRLVEKDLRLAEFHADSARFRQAMLEGMARENLSRDDFMQVRQAGRSAALEGLSDALRASAQPIAQAVAAQHAAQNDALRLAQRLSRSEPCGPSTPTDAPAPGAAGRDAFMLGRQLAEAIQNARRSPAAVSQVVRVPGVTADTTDSAAVHAVAWARLSPSSQPTEPVTVCLRHPGAAWTVFRISVYGGVLQDADAPPDAPRIDAAGDQPPCAAGPQASAQPLSRATISR